MILRIILTLSLIDLSSVLRLHKEKRSHRNATKNATFATRCNPYQKLRDNSEKSTFVDTKKSSLCEVTSLFAIAVNPLFTGIFGFFSFRAAFNAVPEKLLLFRKIKAVRNYVPHRRCM